MRGKVFHGRFPHTPAGITPAYAGKSVPQNRINVFVKDHPRLCGEKTSLSFRNAEELGSPPPMRGKALTRYYNTFQIGITPAYAGKSQSSQ